ncbi:MAG: hypothetical protein J6D13_07820, partial [Clostridium sp.]|nr:hypothetical protein [Clostridium sp.]
MKNVWKRTACLLLSGLLLFGSVPVQALATEEVVEEVFEETIKPLDEEGTDQTDSRQMISLVTDEVLEEDPSLQEITYYPVYVNEIQITSDNMWDVLNDGTVSYDGSGRLTLNGAVLTGIRADSAPLTINLVGENEIYAGDLTAIQTGRDLTITGEGSLAVTTENAIAVSVAGSGEEENKVGLIVDGAQLSVLVSENTDVTEWYPVGISSVNGVRIQKDAHVVTSHTAASQVYTVCAGYIKEEGQESFFPVAAEQEITATGGGLEFVSGEHVTYSATDTQHVLGCHQDCQLTKRTVLTGAHSEGQERDLVATCRTLAFCSVCNREYGKLKDHTGEEQWFPTEDGS